MKKMFGELTFPAGAISIEFGRILRQF